MPWAVAAAAVTAIGSNVAANKASNAAKSTARDSKEAAALQADYSVQASGLLDPFQQIGQQGLDQAGFLTNQQTQFDWLQNNPLFQMGLDNANTQTNQMAAARGRLSAGDTLQQLNQNALLTAMPLIQGQKNSIGDLLNYGQSTAANQGNLLTGQGAVLTGGIMGARNAMNSGVQADMNNINTLAGLGSGLITNYSGGK